MTARVLLSGVLHKAPTRKTSKTGKPFVVAKVREGSGDGACWWTVFTFSETAMEEIERLGAGEAIAASGTFEATIWTPEGREPRVNLTITADAVLSAHKPTQRKASVDKPVPSPGVAAAGGPAPSPWNDGGALNDDIPF
jgi:hypothetical protein